MRMLLQELSLDLGGMIGTLVKGNECSGVDMVLGLHMCELYLTILLIIAPQNKKTCIHNERLICDEIFKAKKN